MKGQNIRSLVSRKADSRKEDGENSHHLKSEPHFLSVVIGLLERDIPGQGVGFTNHYILQLHPVFLRLIDKNPE